MEQKFKAVISIDFDGTIVENAYPELGKLRKGAVKYINKLYDKGYGIVINTCRTGEFEKDVIDMLVVNGVKYHYINENFPHLIEEYKSDCRKISADVYIDDKCLSYLNSQIPSWKKKYKAIKKKFKNNDDSHKSKRVSNSRGKDPKQGRSK